MKSIASDRAALIAPRHLQRGLAERPDHLSDDRHQQIVRRVIRLFQAMKRDQPRVPKPYQAGGEWAVYFNERQLFYDRLLAGDGAHCGVKLRNFWRNELGPIVKEYAKYEQLVNQQQEVVQRFEQNITRNYLIWKEIVGGEVKMLRTPSVGNPWGYEIEGELVVPKATRFHAMSEQLQDLTQDVKRPLIAEVGGGYGGVAYYLLRDRPDTTYVDFDLPETLLLAAYYLLCCLPERNLFLYGEGPIPQGEAIHEYSAVLLPNYGLPHLADRSVDVCFNSFSFSEVPWPTLVEYMSQVERVVKSYFLHNNVDRPGVVNRGFERIPASAYPLDATTLKRLYKRFDLFHGSEGDYREFLYQRTSAA